MKLWQKILLSAVIVGGVILIYRYHINTQEQLEKAKILSEKQTTDIQILQNKLEINKQQANNLAKEINKAQNDKMQPVAHITVEAPNIDTAAKYVTEKINDLAINKIKQKLFIHGQNKIEGGTVMYTIKEW